MSLRLRLFLIVCGVFAFYLLGTLAMDYVDNVAEERRVELLRSNLLQQGTCHPFDGAVVCLGETEDGPVIVEHDGDGEVVNVIPIEP